MERADPEPAWRWELGDREALCCASVDAERVAEPSEDPRAVIESGLYVEALLATLPERERAVMRLVSEGVGPTEIAAMLGLHKETVGRLLVQAVVRLRRAMGAATGEEEWPYRQLDVGDRSRGGYCQVTSGTVRQQQPD